jgi:diadenosine tetraphosphate (Ap4A) HIT family hydrolase
MKCIFCEIYEIKSRIILQNSYAYAISDQFPVSQGHTLIILKRHVPSIFEASSEEITSIFDLAMQIQKLITKQHNPDGYNVGFNDLKAAGQSIPHCHMHIIPRYQGDVENPRGGIRAVIPGKQNY